MDVLFVVPALRNKGPVLVCRTLIENLLIAGHYCEIWYFDEEKDFDFPCAMRRINFFSRQKNISKFDVVHTHGIRPDAWIYLQRKMGFGGKSISTMHNYMNEDLRYQYNGLVSFFASIVWSYFLKFHSGVAVLSQHAADYYRDRLKCISIYVVNNGVNKASTELIDDGDMLLINKLREKFFILGACAQVTRRKGLEQIIDLLKVKKSAAFVIVGNGKDLELLKSRARDNRVMERCLFLGYRSHAVAYIKNFDAVTLPSRSEGFPLSLIEAMAEGRAALISDLPVFMECINSNSAAIFKLDDENSLANAYEYLVENRVTISTNAYTQFETKFTGKVMAENYIKIYTEL